MAGRSHSPVATPVSVRLGEPEGGARDHWPRQHAPATSRPRTFRQTVAGLVALGVALCHAAAPSEGGDGCTLVENGKSRCVVVVPADTSPIEEHASSELRAYLHKVSGAEVAESREPRSGPCRVFLGTLASCPRIRTMGLADRVAELGAEGFLLRADAGGMLIAGRNPIGVLYGVYTLLEDQVGLRWFFPGEEGEYCPRRATIRIPALNVFEKPAFTIRTLSLTCTHPAGPFDDVWNWMARNKMQIRAIKHPYAMKHLDKYLKRGAYFYGGGHVLPRFVPERLFAERPQYFPLIKGKRRLLNPDPRTRNQPCTTHPDVADRAVQYIVDFFRREPEGGVFLLGNNDGQGWCQCERCVALDPPVEREQGFVSTRFYTFINEVARRAYEQYPSGMIRGWGYQNFQHPPTGVRPHPRLTIAFAMHGRCYRHSLDDESCAANDKHRDYIAGWSKFGNEVMSREYYSCFVGTGGTPDGVVYLPLERLVAGDIRYLHRVGVRGWEDEVPPMNAAFGRRFNRREITESWRARFPLYYVAAKLLWNVEEDVDALLADLHAKLYGPAAPAMAKYRALLTDCWHETAGHCIYGFPYVGVGRSLALPGAEDKLLAYLDQAEAAAAGKPTILTMIRRDREYFELAWRRASRQFQAMATGDVHAQRREGPIVVDGVLDEPSWRTAEYVTGFIRRGTERAKQQTYVRLLYDTDHLYLGIEAEEPQTDQLQVDYRTRDTKVWSDDNIEVFIDPDGTGARYYHLAVNPSGALYDANCKAGAPFDTSLNADCKRAAAVLDDRWVVELRLRAASIGAAIRDGGQWKMNVARSRKAGGAREHSTWFDGAYHQPSSFRTVVFGAEGVIQNGGFEDLIDLDTDLLLKRYGRQWAFGNTPPRVPRSWYLHDAQRGTATVVEDAHSGRYAWCVERGWVQQRMRTRLPPDRPLRVEFWAKGKGRLRVAAYLYAEVEKKLRFRRSALIGSLTLNADWRRYELLRRVNSRQAPIASLVVWVDDRAVLDDVQVGLVGGLAQ